MVRSSWEGGGDGPERRVYRLTSKGLRQLREDADAIGQVVAALARFIGDYHEVAARLEPDGGETRAGGDRTGARGEG